MPLLWLPCCRRLPFWIWEAWAAEKCATAPCVCVNIKARPPLSPRPGFGMMVNLLNLRVCQTAITQIRHVIMPKDEILHTHVSLVRNVLLSSTQLCHRLKPLGGKGKGMVHPKIEISPVYSSPLCRLRLWWHLLIRVTALDFHRGKEFDPVSIQWKAMAAMYSNIKKQQRNSGCFG